MSRAAVAFILVLASVNVLAQRNVIVKTITVRGAKIISRDAILAAMGSKEGSILQQSQLRNDETRILDLGYFKDVQILTRMIGGSDTEAELIVEVAENPVIREILVRGNTVLSSEELTALVVEIQTLGNIYNNRNGRQIQVAIEDAYRKAGYFIQIEGRGPDPESEGTLLITIIEQVVREIRLIGLHRTDEKVILRIMKTKPGQPYSPRVFRRDAEELLSTFWFESVVPDQFDTNQVGVYDLELEFVEARTGQINGGVALDPQSRLVGFISYSDSNFNGMGQSVGVNLSQATIGGGLSAEFAWGNRFYDARDTSVNVSIFSRVVFNFASGGFGNFDSSLGGNFDERRTGGSILFSRPFSEINRGTIGMRFERVETLDFRQTGVDSFVQQDGDRLSFQLGVDRDTRHPSVEPYEGELARILVEPSYSNVTKIGGTVSTFDRILGPNYYLRGTLEYRKYISKRMPDDTPIDQVRPVVAIRVRYGRVIGDTPFFEQVFVGGLDSLRGYQNQRFWGKESLAATVEYRYPIQRTFSVIAFSDYGAAWGGYPGISNLTQRRSPDFHLGYGLGVSFRTPVGPIRIDFAFNDEGGSRTHFAFGTSF
ncbi:MAG: BamA/TamA family outer membrane protein [Armatimonadetes bacterium]|nr:BamA/TamA family outer membrane protein [Armatimonadota bacterium]